MSTPLLPHALCLAELRRAVLGPPLEERYPMLSRAELDELRAMVVCLPVSFDDLVHVYLARQRDLAYAAAWVRARYACGLPP